MKTRVTFRGGGSVPGRPDVEFGGRLDAQRTQRMEVEFICLNKSMNETNGR